MLSIDTDDWGSLSRNQVQKLSDKYLSCTNNCQQTAELDKPFRPHLVLGNLRIEEKWKIDLKINSYF